MRACGGDGLVEGVELVVLRQRGRRGAGQAHLQLGPRRVQGRLHRRQGLRRDLPLLLAVTASCRKFLPKVMLERLQTPWTQILGMSPLYPWTKLQLELLTRQASISTRANAYDTPDRHVTRARLHAEHVAGVPQDAAVGRGRSGCPAGTRRRLAAAAEEADTVRRPASWPCFVRLGSHWLQGRDKLRVWSGVGRGSSKH